ncbi:MAG: PorV/PorQ family protein [Candidatus Eisenbacteria bacterium]|nr:PorV/PorQ family protein [Candidatus Latescibacterota bacterium]MBD3301640.1 PorV/PorQ family protein [Candidatus Eisenbacteria bacterium]
MKMQFRTLFGTAVLLLALGVGTAMAGNADRIGTAGGQELTIPNSARGLALGGGAVADAGGVEMLWYNPAAIASVRNVEAYFSNLSYIADMDKSYVAVAVKGGFGTIAVSADVLQIGDIIETTEDAPEGTGRVFSPNFSILGLSYGRYMTDQVRIGTTLKVVNESILNEQATGVTFDAGILYRPGPRGVSFGLALKNFGPNMQFTGSDFESFHRTADNPNANDRALASQSAAFELPSYFELGARYEVGMGETSELAGYGSFRSNNFNNDEVKVGAEYSYEQTVFLRGGGVLSANDDYLFGPAFGAGVAIPVGAQSVIYADYTLRTVSDYFDDNHMFAVKFEF